MPFKKIEKGKKGQMLTKDVDMIDKNPLGWGKITSPGSDKPTSGLESVASSPEERRPISWDDIQKG